MSVQHHDLIHELPEYRDAIHVLKMENAHFRKLFDEYHQTTQDVENMESGALNVATAVEEQAKLHRLHLKDQLFAMLKAHTATSD